MSLAIRLRRELASARDEAELVRNINPVISWDNFVPLRDRIDQQS